MSPVRASVVACSGAFVAALSTSLVAVAAPAMARDLHATQAGVGWVLTAYLLVISCLLATMGRLADVLGRRRMYVGGFWIFTVASFACGFAPTLAMLVAARVAAGIGASMVMATGPAIITSAFPVSRRARALGVQLAVTYAGLSLGPTVGGVLTSALGWNAVFFAVGGSALIGAVVSSLVLEADEAPASRGPLDPVGALLFAIGLATLLLALRRGASPWLFLVALVAFVLFARHEARHPAPILPPALLRLPAFAFGIGGAVLLYVVAFVLSYLLPFHLQHARAMDPAHAGLLMTAQPVTMAVVAPVSGWLADRFGPRGPSTAGMLAMAGGLVLVSRAASGTDVAIVCSLAVVGLGAGLYVAPNNAVIMGAAPRDRQGTAAAMAATARNVGMAAGVALAVALGEPLGLPTSLLVAAGIAALGALLGLVRPQA